MTNCASIPTLRSSATPVIPGPMAVPKTMIAVAIACLPVVFTGAKIARWEGVLFLSYYLLYTGFLYLRSEQHELIEEFSLVMIAFVLPMTALGLVLTMVLAVRSGKTTGEIRRRKRAEKAGGGPKS